MFYLMTHSTHFIYSYMASNYIKDHSDSERRNLLPPLYGLYAPSHRIHTMSKYFTIELNIYTHNINVLVVDISLVITYIYVWAFFCCTI